MRSNVTKRRDAGTRLASLCDSPLSCASLATASLSSRVMECSRMSWRSSEQAKPMFTAVSTLSPVSTQRRMPPSASAAMACGTPTCKARATRCASTCGHAHADMGMRTCTCGHAHADMHMRSCTSGLHMWLCPCSPTRQLNLPFPVNASLPPAPDGCCQQQLVDCESTIHVLL